MADVTVYTAPTDLPALAAAMEADAEQTAADRVAVEAVADEVVGLATAFDVPAGAEQLYLNGAPIATAVTDDERRVATAVRVDGTTYEQPPEDQGVRLDGLRALPIRSKRRVLVVGGDSLVDGYTAGGINACRSLAGVIRLAIPDWGVFPGGIGSERTHDFRRRMERLVLVAQPTITTPVIDARDGVADPLTLRAQWSAGGSYDTDRLQSTTYTSEWNARAKQQDEVLGVDFIVNDRIVASQDTPETYVVYTNYGAQPTRLYVTGGSNTTHPAGKMLTFGTAETFDRFEDATVAGDPDWHDVFAQTSAILPSGLIPLRPYKILSNGTDGTGFYVRLQTTTTDATPWDLGGSISGTAYAYGDYVGEWHRQATDPTGPVSIRVRTRLDDAVYFVWVGTNDLNLPDKRRSQYYLGQIDALIRHVKGSDAKILVAGPVNKHAATGSLTIADLAPGGVHQTDVIRANQLLAAGLGDRYIDLRTLLQNDPATSETALLTNPAVPQALKLINSGNTVPPTPVVDAGGTEQWVGPGYNNISTRISTLADGVHPNYNDGDTRNRLIDPILARITLLGWD